LTSCVLSAASLPHLVSISPLRSDPFGNTECQPVHQHWIADVSTPLIRSLKQTRRGNAFDNLVEFPSFPQNDRAIPGGSSLLVGRGAQIAHAHPPGPPRFPIGCPG